jgi:hypothetical protein
LFWSNFPIINKEFGPFKYREAVPLLHQTIISALPNEKNNPVQTKFYEAFAGGNVEEVLKIPRKERKQIFITSMAAYYASDLSTAQFGATDFRTRTGTRMGGNGDDSMEREMQMMREMEMMGARSGRGGPQFSPTVPGTEGAVQPEQHSGFVVTIAGYSPYKNIGELMDPSGVGDKTDKWGFVTRLLHFADVNGPFHLYKKAEAEHFKLEMGEVGIGVEMPPGIGAEEIKLTKTPGATPIEAAGGEAILIDPMTKEVISREAELDEFGKPKLDRSGKPLYKVNDYWFILSVKFVWKDAPKVEPPAAVQAATPYTTPYPAPTTTQTPASREESSGSRSGRKSKVDIDF